LRLPRGSSPLRRSLSGYCVDLLVALQTLDATFGLARSRQPAKQLEVRDKRRQPIRNEKITVSAR